MKLRNLFLGVCSAVAVFAACQPQEENLGTPDISIDKNEMTFEVAGGEQQLAVTATRDWKVETDADWVAVSPESGSGSLEPQTVTVTALENTGMDRSADLKFTIGMKSKYLTVSQAGPGGSPEALIIYANDMDKGKVQKVIGSDGKEYWPYPDQSDAWRNEEGSGIANLEYASKGVSIRSVSSTNNIWFPAAGGSYISVKNLELGSATSMQLTFDCIHGSNNGHKKEFSTDKFKVYLSNDNAKWVELPYELSVKSETEFDTAKACFSVSDTKNMSMTFQFLGDEDGYRMTNINLSIYDGEDVVAVDFANGVEMDFAAGNTGGGNQGGGSSDATAIYSNNYDKSAAVKDGDYWPYLDKSDAWKNAAGTGAANVTYASKNVTVRNNSNSNGNFSDYDGSGMNNIFFGKDYPYFATKNIALGGATGLTLTFGTEKYSQTDGSTFTNSEYHIWLSNDGTKWVELTDYTFAGTADGRWNVATANFTVPAGTENLSICMQVDVASAYRLDDFKLVASEGGAAVDFSAAVEKDFNAGATDGDGGEDEPDTPVAPSEPGEYDPQGITWTLGTNAYDNTSSGTNAQSAIVNGVGVANLLKLGTGSKIGDATLHVPAGTEKIGFYCVAWNGKTAQVKFSINGEELGTIQPKANTGAANNAPYTITVTDSDYYVIDMPSTDAVDVKVETVDPANGRALFIKLEANPSSEGGEVTPPEGGEVTPPEGGETPEPGTVGTIADVLALGNGATIPANTVIEGVVISNMELNNLTSKKGMYVQDETAALQFFLAANHEFAFGDKVQIDLSGVSLADYHGAVQVSGLALDKITKISSGNTVTPKTVSIDEFLANKYEGQYIAIEGVQVVSADLSKTFVMGGAHTSINMEDASGNKFVVFSSKYATYGTTAVPQGSGTIKGISSINNGNMQIIFAQNSDFAGLTGTRFDGTEVTPPTGGGAEGGETPVAGNRADFETLSRTSSYGASTTTDGWILTNCAVQEGGEKDSNPVYILLGKVAGTDTWAKAACMNGKTSASGTIESPELSGGCGTLSFDYANIFSEANGVNFKIEVIQNGAAVKTIVVDEDSITKMTKYTFTEEVNVSGSFKLKFTNLCPTNDSSKNKDRVSIWNLVWTSVE